MPTISRNPIEFMRRCGLVEATSRPSPRLDPSALLINTYPLAEPPGPSTNVLRALDGSNSPDRGMTRPWPSQTAPEE